MHFTISSSIFSSHPALSIGLIIATGIDNTKSSPEISQLLRTEEQKIRSTFTLENFRDHPHLAALQEVHRGFGSNPNKFPPSIQSLIKRILKGSNLPSINPLVDLYNVLSLRHLVCAGAEDLDVCTGDIELTPADGTEHFVPLGESAEDPPEKGELVYKDRAGVICRKLNWREGDRTKITEATKNALLVIEGFSPLSNEIIMQILKELSELLQKYCSAKVRAEVLTKDKNICHIS